MTALSDKVLATMERVTSLVLRTLIARRMTSFLSDISERWVRGGTSTPVAWLRTRKNEANRAACRDVWAAGVLRFEREANTASLPF